MKKIVLTGGGTAGHVTPNLALIPRLTELGYEIRYIGSYEGIEKELVTAKGLSYDGISSGKLRRYASLKNVSDVFRVLKGLLQSKKLLKEIKPDVVFSKGGFVTVPVVRAAHSLKIPCILHESDLTPGLANRLAIPYAKKICCNFPETLSYLPSQKAVLTGSPIRAELLSGDKERALRFTGLSGQKSVLLVIGGSLGATVINDTVREALSRILQDHEVIHLCGRDKLDPSLEGTPGYRQYEYITDELPDLFALADVVISRAGANAICELLALKKPNLLIPLSAKASRGDQILNAESFEKQGFSRVLAEEDLTADSLVAALEDLEKNRDSYVEAMAKAKSSDGVSMIVNLIEEIVN